MFKSTSSTISPFVSFLLLQCLFLPTVLKAEECIDVSSPTTRTFKSLVDLQTNNKSFYPHNTNFEGNYVAFSKSKIDTIPKNSFVTYDSKYIEKLILDDHGVRIIQDGAFISLTCLRYLELQKNQLTGISKGVFQDLTKLHELNLGENSIVEIPERVFTFLVRLKKLNLTKNKIKTVHPDSFYGLSSLEELDISYNYLSNISPDIFQYFGRLTNLQLEANQIEYLELDKCINLSNLKILNLAFNGLQCFDTTYNYSFSGNLTELYLSGNSLTKMNPDGFKKSLPALKVIDIEDNPWSCSDLTSVLRILNDSHIRYKGSSISEPSVGGIACNISVVTQKTSRLNYDSPTLFVTTTEIPDFYTKEQSVADKPQVLISVDVLDSIKYTQTVIVCLLVVIVIFIIADVAVRCGCLNFWLNRRRQTFFDNADGDDSSLLRDRF